MTSTKCSECGAAARSEEGRFCAYCGARFPEAATPPVVSAADGRRARLEALGGRPEVQAELRRQVSTAPLATRQGCGLIPIGFAIAVAWFIASTAGAVGGAGAPGLFFLVPAAMVIMLVVKAIGGSARTLALASSASTARVVEVRDLQTETTGHGEHLSSVRRVILEDEGGSRSNLEVSDKTARRLAPGDTGVAHLAGGHLLAFKRFEI
ncbi:MAG: hypothetical protein P8M11_15785 [Planctomycetota bacterium]|nr:hypothetical protein [Planctomycetota bacterium]